MTLKYKRRMYVSLPDELYDELKHIANQHQTTPIELVRKFVGLGLVAIKMQESEGDDALLVRENGEIRELLIL